MKSTVTAVVAVLAVGVLLVGGFLALKGDGSEERREDRQTARQAGQAGQCAPQSEKKAQAATRAFLDEFLAGGRPGHRSRASARPRSAAAGSSSSAPATRAR